MRLINADDLVNKIVFYTKIPIPYKERVEDAIQDMPTVDAVEVVRCKDCKHWHPSDYCTERDGLWYENDFCAYGERGEADDK